jgi:hypothetical protein
MFWRNYLADILMHGQPWQRKNFRAAIFQCEIPHPPSICMNIKGKGLRNLHFVTD